MEQKYIFIDRDGVINRDGSESAGPSYITRWEDFEFLPGVLSAFKKAADLGYKCIIISNQQCVGKGIISGSELEELTGKMVDEIVKAGGDVAGVYYCPHLKEEKCECRKPKKGLFEKAEKELGISLKDSGFCYIGDSETDALAGKAAGLKTILVLSGKTNEGENKSWAVNPDHISNDLEEAIDFIAGIQRKKIVILFSTSGLGHYNSAKAIYQAFQRFGEDLDIKFINILDHGNKFFRFFHFKFYVSLMKYGKKLWGLFYFISDISFFDVIIRAFRHFADMLSWRGLKSVLIKEDPDAIIATHFFMTSIARAVKSNKKFHAKLFLMVSGFGMHNIWSSKHVDRFFAAVPYVSDELVRRGVKRDRVTVTGMPAPEEFSREYDRNFLMETYGLVPDKKTILILSGAFGAAPIESILETLRSCDTDIQVITVCGYNKKAFTNVNEIKNELGYPVKLFGFTDNISELMTVSDLMVSKAGTLSVTQALNMRLPMILFSHMPGHETPTVNLLDSAGAAKRAKNVKDIPVLVDTIFNTKDMYKNMTLAIDKLRRPNAADDMVNIVLDEINE